MESSLWIKIDVLSWLFLDLRLTAYPFGGPEFTPVFLWGSYCSIFSLLCSVLYIVVCSFAHCVVCHSSIYGLWLPIWHHQSLLTMIRAKDWLNWKSCNDVYSISLNVFFIKDLTKVHMTWLIKIQLNMILYYLLIKYEIWYRTLLQTVCIII